MYCTYPSERVVTTTPWQMIAQAPRDRMGFTRPFAGSLRQVRRPQQSEVRLQACGVGEPNFAKGSDAKARRRVNKPADCLRCFFALTQAGAAQRQDAIGEGEIAVAVDRLARVCHRLFISASEQASQGERESGKVKEGLTRA